MKIVCGLGNPGTEYESTRHNVGWWVVRRAREMWHLPPFRRDGNARVSDGFAAGHGVRLVQPLTWMNRSGAALVSLPSAPDIDLARDLLVVVDDAVLDVGRLRFRAAGGSGGHNGLKSVEAVLGTQVYARLRIGVGSPPPDIDLVDWVLSAMPREDEDGVIALLDEAVEAIAVWMDQGVDVAASRFNR